jgi:hypothetical protein
MRFTRNRFVFWLAIICAIMLSQAMPRAEYMNFGPRTYEPSSSPYSYWRRPPGGFGAVGRAPGGNIRCLNGYGGKFSRCMPTTGPSVIYPPRAPGGYGTFIRPYYPRYTYPYPYTYPTPEPPVAQPAPQEPAPTAARHAPKPQEPVPTAARHPPKPPAPSKAPPPAAVVKHEAPPPPLPRIQSATPCLRDVNAAKYFAGGNDDSKSFQSVKRRIAFFAFDDPYNTGLGEIISSIMPKTIVCSATRSGVAVINYAEGAAQDNSRHVAYFDKVDGALQDQGFPFAVWGWITPTPDGVHVDSFIQVPTTSSGAPFEQVVSLPKAMGGGRLAAGLKPDRITLQSVDLGAEDAKNIGWAAGESAKLRKEPNVQSPPVTVLSKDRSFKVVESQGTWIRVLAEDGASGWTSAEEFCVDRCSDLLDTARFANDMAALVDGAQQAPVSTKLTDEARSFSDQLAALMALGRDPARAMEILAGPAAGQTTPDGQVKDALGPWTSGRANLLAVARVAAALEEAKRNQPHFDNIRLPPELIRNIANRLAEASVADPTDLTILDNLAVLFGYLDDRGRRNLALRIAAETRSRNQP